VKNTGSLSAAAEVLNYTQSGMTHMMNALEKELGVTLLVRGRNGVALTPEATRLLPRITEAAAAMDALDAALEQLRDHETREIRVGAYSSMAAHWLPEIVQRFRTEFPDIGISLRMGTIREIYSWLKNGELDCAFVSYQHSEVNGSLEWIPLHNDELVAILPEDYPIDGALFSVRGFDGLDFLMPTNGFDLDISPMFVSAGVRPNVRDTNMDDPAIISMVEHGLGISVLTELVMRGRKARVLALPLNPPFYRELGIMLRIDMREKELVADFIRHAKNTIIDLYKS